MNQTIKPLLIALALAAWQSRSVAQVAVTPLSDRETRGGLSLEETLQRSLRFNPEMAKLGATLADKLGRAIQTETKWNPNFKLTGGRTSDREGVGSAFEFEVEQPFRPSDFGLRKTYAAALRVAANLEQQADVLRVLNATAITYYRAWSLQERVALLGGARAQAETVLGTIQEQLEAGQSNVSQRSLFEAEVARFSAELLAVRGEHAGAQAELERAIGRPVTNTRLLRPTEPSLPSTRVLVAFAESRSGIRRIALAQRAAAAKGLSVARADAVFPEFAPGLIASYASRSNESGIGLTIAGRIPIWDRNQGEIVRLRGALDAADRELESFDLVGLERSVAARRQQLINLQARAAAYRDQVTPAYRAAYDATLAQFRAGQATTLQLFEVQRSLVEAQEKSFQYAVESLSARTHLEQLIGGRIEEAAGGDSTRSNK
ncbi:MAG TPA: TolC family protein [Chthoniobacterales bacterium]|jgi:outer membrane protein TolC|nr:TolC family protein [Chthoniobacterales bacterium]